MMSAGDAIMALCIPVWICSESVGMRPFGVLVVCAGEGDSMHYTLA